MLSLTPVGGAQSAVGSAATGSLSLSKPLGASQLGAGATAGADFSAVMSQLAGDAIGGLKTAEAASILGVRGQLPTQDVVEAVLSAEKTLQTAVAVRDKVVAAYLDLSRMQI